MPDLTQITSPSGVKFTVAKDAAEAFGGFLSDLEGAGYKIDQGSSGGYNPRNIAGTNTPSQHAFGHAIDINPGSNPHGAKGPSDLPPNIGDLAAKHGLTWGGTWSGDTRDPMHFELTGKTAVADNTPSADDLLARVRRLQGGAGGAESGPATSTPAQGDVPSSDDLLARVRALQPLEAKPSVAPVGGVVRNIGAGAVEGGAGAINAVTDPTQALIYHPLAVGASYAAPAIARLFGMSPDRAEALRKEILGEGDQANIFGSGGLGTAVTRAIGNAVGVQPSDVPATTPPERIARAGTAGVVASGLIPGGPVRAGLAGAGGAVGGEELANIAPNWLKPGAELVGNVLGGVAMMAAPDITLNPGATVSRGANALAAPFQRYAETGSPFAPKTPSDMTPIDKPSDASAAGRTAEGEGAQPAGAMVTPYAASRFTPAEEAAYRATAEGQKLMENQKIGEPDTTQYIRGVTANAAEQEQTASMARDLKSLGLKSPEITQDIKEAVQNNDAARREHLMDTAKSPVDTRIVRTNREDAIEADKATVFAPENVKGDVSMQPLLDQIKAERTVPENIENSPLQAELAKWEKRLTNEDGSARTMGPQQAWGLRRDIDRQLDPMMKSENSNLHYVGGSMRALSDTLDKGIEAAAPGYNGMLSRYKEFSRQIEEMELLQKAERDLGSKPLLRFNDFQRFMKGVVDSRATPASDLNVYKSLSEETMQRLWALRDDLRRSASASDLARAPGSDTVPNIIDLLRKHAGEAGLQYSAHAVGSAFGMPPGTANLILGAGRQAMRPFFDARREAAERARAQSMLYPPQPPQQPSLP